MAKELVGASRFQKLDASRQAHLNRQRVCSALTLPFLLPPSDATENTPLATPWQSMGARCTNNLASKVVLTLMPPNNTCFRFIMDENVKQEMEQAMGKANFRTQVEEVLSLREVQIQQWMEKSKIRVPAYRILRLLIVTGNCLIFRKKAGGIKVYRLDQYVARRNGEGEVVEIIVKDLIDPVDLPQRLVEGYDPEADTGTDSELIPAYTYCIRKGKGKKATWHVHQEVNGKLIPNTRSKFNDKKFPFRALTWSRADGENYGRGHVEEHLGDFSSLEELRKAIVETTSAGAKLVFLRNPNGYTRKKDLIEAENGEIIDGMEGDVATVKVEKGQDLQVAASEAAQLKQSLAEAFLLHASIQRNGDRVTAEEIRFMAQDIEDGLGGIYSILAQEFQLPLVEWAIEDMEEQQIIAPLPPEISITITTGLEALGRGHDLQKLQLFVQQLSVLGPEAMQQYLILTEFIKRVAAALGINISGLVKTEDQIKQEQAQAQQQEQALMQQQHQNDINKEVTKGAVAKQQQQGE